MIKTKDGYAKVIGTTYQGNPNYLLQSDGGAWAVHTGKNNEANKIVRTDNNGYLQVGWINTTSGDMGTGVINKIYCSNDSYIRYKTPANFFSSLANSGDQISITVASQDRLLTVGYATTASQLRSKGTLAPQTGRTQSLGDVYSYHITQAVTGGPTTYAAVIGFGRGTAGTVEIAGEWTSGRGVWVRALRDVSDDWYAWDKVLTQTTYHNITDGRYYTKAQSDERFVNVTEADGRFVKKAGDTMSGVLTINVSSGATLLLNSPASDMGIRFMVSGASKGWVGYYTTLGTNLYNYVNAQYLSITDAGYPAFGNAGNYQMMPYTKYLGSRPDYIHSVILLWKDGEINRHRLTGKLFTSWPGAARYQGADVDFWFSRWNASGYDSSFRFDTYGLGTPWDLVTCTYGGATWWALRHRNTQATSFFFQGTYYNVSFTQVNYYNTQTGVLNAEINNSIVQRNNWYQVPTVGGTPYALITSNVASATKLQTARTLWGQLFDGTANVSGSLSGVTTISMSGYINNKLKVVDSSDWSTLQFGGVHNVAFGGFGEGYAHRVYYFRPAGATNGQTNATVYIQNASATNNTYTTTHTLHSDGNATHTGYNLAAGFKKSGSNDTYVLLGGGGHKLLSSIQSEYDGRYVNVAGDTMIGILNMNWTRIRMIGSTATPAWNSAGAITWAENDSDSQAVSLVYTSYDSYRSPAGLKLMGSQGNEWLEAPRFIKTGSNDNYILLGGGNHLALSTLQQAVYTTLRDFKKGTLITTSINYSVTDGDPFYLEIKGNTYGRSNSCFTQAQGYIYGGTIINYGVTHLGFHHIAGIIAMNVGGKLCFWFPRQTYWEGYSVFCCSAYNYRVNVVQSVTDSSDPGGTKRVTLTSNTKESVFKDSLSDYYTKTEADDRFVNVTGDTMTGKLNISISSSSSQVLSLLNSTAGWTYMTMGNSTSGAGAVHLAWKTTANGDIPANAYHIRPGCSVSIAAFTSSAIYLASRLIIDSTGRCYPINTNARRTGMYGTYDSYRIGHIWSMGTGYMIPDNGANFGNLYGLAYKHTNNSTGGIMAGGHQAVWCENGTPKAAMGANGVWAAGGFYKSGCTAAHILRGDGGQAAFNWSGQAGQPSWLWGGNNQHDYYVYNPSNFSVNYATSANKANKADQLEAYVQSDFTGGNHYLRAIRYDSWHTRLYMGYYRDATLQNTVHVGYADNATYASYLTQGFSATFTSKWNCNAPDRVIYSDYGSAGRSIANIPSGWQYGTLLELGHINYRGLNGYLNIQLMWDVAHNTKNGGTLWFRGRDSVYGWDKNWCKVITDQNYTGILDGRYVNITGDTMTGALKFNVNNNGNANVGSGDGFKLFYNHTTGTGFPVYYSNVASFLTGYTGFQLASSGGGDQTLYFRKRQDNGTWHSWYSILHTGNYTATLDARYVTALSTKNDYLTWTKNGVVNNITIPYATKANRLTLVSCYGGTTNNDLWSKIKTSDSAYIGTAIIYEVYNDGGPTTYGEVLDIVSVHSNHWQPQLWFDSGKTGSIRHRNKDHNNNTWGSWYTLLDTNNYTGTLDTRYVTSLGTSENSLTWTKNGVTNKITVPYSLNSDKLDGYHASSFYENGYVMFRTEIDASALNVNTYYPVTFSIGSHANVRIECRVSLNSLTTPSWSTHKSGFSVRKIWEVNGSGWGTNPINRRILVSDYQYASSDPVVGVGQLSNSSVEYVYVRGGGKYFFYISHNIGATLRTSTYTTNSQSVGPTTSAPTAISTPTLTLVAGKFSGLTYKPLVGVNTVYIPTSTSHLTNDSGFWTGTRYWANIAVSTTSSTGTAPTFNTCYTSNWFRSTGKSGWFSESYGGGIYMIDSTWVRTYGSKNFYCSAVIQAGGRIYTGYDSGVAQSVSCSNWFRSSEQTGWYNATYGGGIYQTDSDSVRIYGSKVLYNDGSRVWGIGGHNTGLKLYAAANVGINLANGSYTWGIYSNNNGNMYIGRRTGNANDSSGSYYHILTTSYIQSPGFYHSGIGSDDYVLLAGGSYKSLGDFAKGNAGSNTKGVYVTNGIVTAMSYYLYANVNSGTAGKLAYYYTSSIISSYTGSVGNAWTPVYLNAGTISASSYSFYGGSSQPVVLVSGYFYRGSTSSGIWNYSGYKHSQIGSPSFSINGGVMRLTFSNTTTVCFISAAAQGRRNFAGRNTGVTQAYDGSNGNYEWDSEGAYWFNTYVSYSGSTGYLYIRAYRNANTHNDSWYTGNTCWGSEEDAIESVSFTIFGYIYH